MFSSKKKKLLVLSAFMAIAATDAAFAADTAIASINSANLPVKDGVAASADVSKVSTGLISPSQAQNTGAGKVSDNQAKPANAKAAPAQPQPAGNGAATAAAPVPDVKNASVETSPKDDFDFDLKMKSINAPALPAQNAAEQAKPSATVVNEADLPKDIQYKANPVENLGNSVLSQMDSDLFTQMSEIEKSTTLLTLELRREKIRNEIEAQKAIRQKSYDDLEHQRAEERLKELEKKKKLEAQVIQEQQALLDKEKIFEVLKQRKLLNAYMNQMLLSQQEWLREKENLYAQIAAVEQEKKELVELFKERLDKVLEASAKNIQTAEAAKANFERIVKGLQTRNEQLRKRVEADAKIIKNAKNNLYLKSQSIEELKDRNAASKTVAAVNTSILANTEADTTEEPVEEAQPVTKLSAKYAILGITGRAGSLSVDVIDLDGQALSLKVGSPLPTGHVVSEIGPDYAKFSRDGVMDYLYVGKSIDGVIPTLEAMTGKSKK